jgi:hypothetical protein
MTNYYLLLIVKFVGINAQKTLFFSSTIVRNSNHDALILFLSLIIIYRLSERAKISKEIND